MHYGDLTDSTNIIRIIQDIQPDEIYTLGAQSHVRVSFETPEYTAQTDGLGTLRNLEALRIHGLEDKTRFYQSSTSELYGKVQEIPQSETTPFYPRSPYAVAKIYSYWIVVNYREAYNMFACNGILFNHESPRRGETFVTRKVTRAAARISIGLQDVLYLGNLNSMRDWGHAKDYVRAQWLILQQDNPDDFVIASGKQYSIRQLCELAFAELGIALTWQDNGLNQKGIIDTISPDFTNKNLKPDDVLVKVDRAYFRTTEVETLLGNPTKAKATLGWNPEISFEQMIADMVTHDLKEAKRDMRIKKNGFIVTDPQ